MLKNSHSIPDTSNIMQRQTRDDLNMSASAAPQADHTVVLSYPALHVWGDEKPSRSATCHFEGGAAPNRPPCYTLALTEKSTVGGS
jgi:hypothetical protein